MESIAESQEHANRLPRPVMGLLMALPFLIPQLIYLSDIHGWNVLLSYGLIGILAIGAIVGWIVYACIETRKRRKLPTSAFRVPWFSAGGLVFLITFFHVGEWAQPMVLRIPDWCRVNQVIEWTTSKPNEKYGGTHSYVLVFVGRGNISDHDFPSGYLNWTGDESTGFSDIDLENRTFSHWVGYDHVTIPATLPVLRKRIEKSGIAEEEVSRVSDEIWGAMNLAREGKPISAATGSVDRLREAPFDQEDTVLGASIWIGLLLVVFQFIAWRSLPPRNPLVEHVVARQPE